MSTAPVRVLPSGLLEPNLQYSPSQPYHSEHMFPLSKHDGPDFFNWDDPETPGRHAEQNQSTEHIQQPPGSQKRKQEDDVVRQNNIARKRKAIIPTRSASAITPALSPSPMSTGTVTPNSSLRELDDLAETYRFVATSDEFQTNRAFGTECLGPVIEMVPIQDDNVLDPGSTEPDSYPTPTWQSQPQHSLRKLSFLDLLTPTHLPTPSRAPSTPSPTCPSTRRLVEDSCTQITC